MPNLFKKFMAASDVELRTGGETGEEGYLKAKFTTFRVQDSYGDIINSKALADHDGAEVALAWAHDWKSLVGKGVIELKRDYATWEGSFFLGTQKGKEAYETVKAMGNLQEYSWGFYVDEAIPIDEKGNHVKDPGDWWWGPVEVMKATPIEVSPVLKGANPITGTMGMKAADLPTDEDGNVQFDTDTLMQFGMRRVKSALLTLPESIHEPETASEPSVMTLDAVSAWLHENAELANLVALRGEIDSLVKSIEATRGVPIGLRFHDLRLLQMRSKE